MLIRELKVKGQNLEMDNVEVAKLIEPSIFDDEGIKDLKATLTEMQEFINECKDMEAIQPELDKMKAEAEKNKTEYGEFDAPVSFGQKPENAAEFKPMVIKSKKRDLATMQKGGDTSKIPDQIVDSNKENKLRKLNEWLTILLNYFFSPFKWHECRYGSSAHWAQIMLALF